MIIPGAEAVGTEVWKRWLLKGRLPEVEDQNGEFTLTHGWRFRLSAVFFFALFLAACLGVCLSPDVFEGEARWKVIGIQLFSAGTVLLSWYVLGTALVDRATVSNMGIQNHRFLQGVSSFVWPEITKVSISKNREWLLFTVLSGSEHKISMQFHGLRSLWDLVEQHVANEQCDPLISHLIPVRLGH